MAGGEPLWKGLLALPAGLLFMGFSLISSSVSNLFVGAWDLESHVLEGTLDAYLVKPCSPMLLILLERANFLRFFCDLSHRIWAGGRPSRTRGAVGRPAGNSPVYRGHRLVELLILAIYELVFWVKKVDSYAR